MDIIFSNVTFGYDHPLFKNLSFHMSEGWSAVVGVNGSGKSTLLRLALRELVPDSGTVVSPGGVCCEQRCDRMPEGLSKLVLSGDGDALKLVRLLSLGEDWGDRWDTLSFGERKRAQIAAALWQSPSLLVIDEPTNHLDRTARRVLIEALRDYRGVGIIVSHDRELLESLPYQCLHLDPPDAVMRPGAYSKGKAEEEREKLYILGERNRISANIAKLKADAAVRKGLAGSADRLRSKKGIGKKDHDAKRRVDMARLSGKDAVQGRILSRLDSRIRQEERKLDSLRLSADRGGDVFMKDTDIGAGFALRMEEGMATAGERIVRFPALYLRQGEKIALTGDNGAGKSTLLRSFAASAPDAFYLPQEIRACDSRTVLRRILGMDNEMKGRILVVVENLGTDVKRLLSSPEPSPGELRKLMIAEAVETGRKLLLLDEPANHMDLHSVELLERCLAECAASMIVVSHDHVFVRTVAHRCWNLEPDVSGVFGIRVTLL